MSSVMPIKVMVSGLPGKMATAFVRAAQKDERVYVVNHAFTGEETKEDEIEIEGQRITLLRPSERKGQEHVFSLVPGFRETIIVDFTEPASVNENVDFYVRNGLYFVLGTTGGDREKIAEDIYESDVSAVVAQNMAVPIVAMNEAIKYIAEQFPGVLKKFSFKGKESHQSRKKDVSGTMKSMIPCFQKLGTDASLSDVTSVRDREEQLRLGVNPEFINAHGYHWYEMASDAHRVRINLEYSVDGQNVYALGAIEAALYLNRKRVSGEIGKIYDMIDVMRNS